MQDIFKTLVVLLLIQTASPVDAHTGHGASDHTAFASIFHHYEVLWQTLANDDDAGVAEHAEAIREAAHLIAADFDVEKAGLADGVDGGEAARIFDGIARAVARLGSAADLAAAREAFYELSKAMVQYNSLLAGERMKVVYCPMVKRSWLQRREEIANPYAGRSMSGCGEIVGP